MNILILDANQRSALAVTRSLGAKRHTIFTADSVHDCLAANSKYSQHYLVSPSPVRDPQAFIEWFIDTVDKNMIDFAIPVTEYSCILLAKHRDRIPGRCTIPVPEFSRLNQLMDKIKLHELATENGIPTPLYQQFSDASRVKPERVTRYPVVVKPALSHVFSGDSWLETKVKICRNEDELRELLRHDKSFSYPFMLQEFIPGSGAGVFLLYRHGQPIAHFAHRRVREKPPAGGVSVLSESVEASPVLLNSSKKLLDAVKWDGVAMVEYRISEAQEPYLMEINTRFWGSLQLSIDAGIDFPALLHESYAENSSMHYRDNYTIGQQLRWLLGDIDGLYLYLKSSDYSPLQKLQRLGQFLLPRFTKRKMEVNRLDDMRPFIFELKNYWSDLFGK